MLMSFYIRIAGCDTTPPRFDYSNVISLQMNRSFYINLNVESSDPFSSADSWSYIKHNRQRDSQINCPNSGLTHCYTVKSMTQKESNWICIKFVYAIRNWAEMFAIEILISLKTGDSTALFMIICIAKLPETRFMILQIAYTART